MTSQILKQKSKKLEQLLADLGPDFGKLETKVDAIFEQGRKEGFSEMEIGGLVRSKMEAHYSDRTIRRVLPDSAKQQQDHSKQKADKISASEREPTLEVPADKVKVESASDIEEGDPSPEEQRVARQQYEEAVAHTKQQINPEKFKQEQSSRPLREQSQSKEVQGIHNIAPEEYKLEELEQYDKPLLIEIVKLLDNNNAVRVESVDKLGEANDNLRREISFLK